MRKALFDLILNLVYNRYVKNLGLYIHIPFCSSKCAYCDFASFVHGEDKQREYFKALCHEIDFVKNNYKDKTFDSIFIGGGTPSIVFDGFIFDLADKLKSSFSFSPNTEFSIEVNPRSLTFEKIEEYERAGINRISMGVQSISSKVLKRVGRFQTKRDIDSAFALIHRSSIKNINCDVMLGLPNQSINSVKRTTKYLIRQGVTHISSYSLQVEEGTPLFNLVANKKLTPATDEKALKMYNVVYKLLKKHGYLRYEVSNFALSGYECRHNMKYWDGTEYLGLGLSAHSLNNNTRTWNIKNLDTYISSLTHDRLPIEDSETLDKNTRKTERIMLALRTTTGLDLTQYKTEFGENILSVKKDTIDAMLKSGLLDKSDNHLKITEPNYYISNSIILELID